MKTAREGSTYSSVEDLLQTVRVYPTDSRPVSSYFPMLPRHHRRPLAPPLVFKDSPRTVELTRGGERLTRQQFQEIFRQELDLERRLWTGAVHFEFHQEKKIQLRSYGLRCLLHGFEKVSASQQTRFLAAEYFDYFVSRTRMELSEASYQVAASTSLRLACKMEEVMMSTSDNHFEFTSETLGKWELVLLDCLQWRTKLPTLFTFITFFFHSTSLSNRTVSSSRIYKDALELAECCVLDSRMTGFRLSMKAACCFMLALKRHAVKDWYKTLDYLDIRKENSLLTVKTCISLISLYWTSSNHKTLFLSQAELCQDFVNGLK